MYLLASLEFASTREQNLWLVLVLKRKLEDDGIQCLGTVIKCLKAFEENLRFFRFQEENKNIKKF